MHPSISRYLYRIAFSFCLWFVIGSTHAQWVSIPDKVFGQVLYEFGFIQCMQGDSVIGWQLDTTCYLIDNTSVLYLNDLGIKQLDGIQYFKNLYKLHCYNNFLTALPPLPDSLRVLYIHSNHIQKLPRLPSKLDTLIAYQNFFDSIPQLPQSLTLLSCGNNLFLNFIPQLPSSLKEFYCGSLAMTQLPNLPSQLNLLHCDYGSLQSLPPLPSSLKYLNCEYNSTIDSLPNLPNGLVELQCGGNNLSFLPQLPDSLEVLGCYGNKIKSLPFLPNKLRTLDCGDNLLDSLKPLPNSLEILGIGYSNINKLNSLPTGLLQLNCQNSKLDYLPQLPASLKILNCAYNNIQCLPQLPNLSRLYIKSTTIKCLPNYPSNLIYVDVLIDTFPLCNMFDTFVCDFYYNISGKVYNDITPDCIKDINEGVQQSVKLNLLKNGVVEQQFVSTQFSDYTFDTNLDTYEVTVDTTDMPYTVACPSTFSHTVTLTPQDSVEFGVDFGLRCKPGFDVGVLSAVRDSGILFPAQGAGVYVQASDLSTLYGLSCASGTSGTVTITYSGPVSFAGVRANSLVPTIAGKTLTYNIADFSTVDIYKAFGLRFVTDTFAQIGQELCLTVTVTPVNGDNNPNNNTATYCFPILNSYDPNMKEVSPVNSILPTEDWLTYTIHFQNMGNAPAIHIYVMDTLDANLDESSIQITGSSHRMITEIKGKVARFNFPNINLIDSATNEPESKGWLQYKIKKKENLVLGTPISNTASIYFDFNAPVVTNTVTTTVDQPNGIAEVKQNINLSVHPNPTNNLLYIHYTSKSQAEVSLHTINGTLCNQSRLNHSGEAISLSSLPTGIYFVTVTVNGTTDRRKVVKY